MSLKIHFPLNGDTRNQGLLGDAQFTIDSYSYTTDGRVGEALSSGNIIMSAATSAKVFNNDEVTIAFWIYPTGTGSGIIFGTNSMTAPNNRKFSIFQYPTANDLHWSWQNDESNTTFTQGSLNGVMPTKVWTHICITYKNPNCTVYINGVKKGSSTGISNSPSFSYSTVIARASSIRYLNDLRIYDNCLSAREVKNLAKGLVCHYPLNDAYATRSINLYTDDYYEGKAFSYTSQFVRTKLPNERGYNYRLSYKGTGNNAYFTIAFPTIVFTAGKKYCFSCKIRRNAGTNTSFTLRAARIQNDWEAVQTNVIKEEGKWIECAVVATMPATYTRSGTTYNVAPRVEFYSTNLSTNGYSYCLDFDLKDIQIAECDDAIPATNPSWRDSVVYDCSGLNNNGSIVLSSAPKASANSPRYDLCYHFDSKHYLTGKTPWGAKNVTELSLSAWINQEEGGSYSTFFSCNGFGGGGLWLGANVENSGQWGYCGENTPYYHRGNKTVSKGTWYLFTYTFDNGVAKWYLNGELTGTTTYTNKYLALANSFTIGDSYTGTTWNTTFVGKISDFRLYSTVLSAEDIKKLYNTPVTLTDSGNLITDGEIIE